MDVNILVLLVRLHKNNLKFQTMPVLLIYNIVHPKSILWFKTQQAAELKTCYAILVPSGVYYMCPCGESSFSCNLQETGTVLVHDNWQ